MFYSLGKMRTCNHQPTHWKEGIFLCVFHNLEKTWVPKHTATVMDVGYILNPVFNWSLLGLRHPWPWVQGPPFEFCDVALEFSADSRQLPEIQCTSKLFHLRKKAQDYFRLCHLHKTTNIERSLLEQVVCNEICTLDLASCFPSTA